ncbi:hypothetical protein [Paraburkholderia aromaticivorans]|uniref:hypothetical protein n=1 Tax=Paraburkholderia aromaticivorans TaxID=2026199 RepID=UPI0038B7E346
MEKEQLLAAIMAAETDADFEALGFMKWVPSRGRHSYPISVHRVSVKRVRIGFSEQLISELGWQVGDRIVVARKEVEGKGMMLGAHKSGDGQGFILCKYPKSNRYCVSLSADLVSELKHVAEYVTRQSHLLFDLCDGQILRDEGLLD